MQSASVADKSGRRAARGLSVLVFASLAAVAGVVGAADSVVTVQKAGAGTGTVASANGAISCGAACTAPFPDGTALTLIATAANGHEFTGWLGPCTGQAPCRFTVNGPVTAQATFAPAPVTAPRLDLDGTGTADALTDGLIIVRALLGVTGAPLSAGLVGTGATRNTPAAIESHLANVRPALDIDGNGKADLADGVLIIRWLMGIRGNALLAGALGEGARRTSPAAIETQLQRALNPGNQPPVVTAGFDQSVTLPAAAALSGSALDDGLPAPPSALA
jgi:hypothetical protein